MSTQVMREFLSTVQETNRYLCPECSHKRKNKHDRSLSVTVDSEGIMWKCHHCDSEGRHTHKTLMGEPDTYKKIKPPTAISVPKESNVGVVEKYLATRGIKHQSVEDKFKIVTGNKFFRAKGEDAQGEFESIGFVYGENEAVKWRTIEGKRFTQDGAARSLWGIDKIREGELPKTLIIAEGEIDCLSIASVIYNSDLESIAVVSVPNGAPSKVSDNKRVSPEDDNKFLYLWQSKDVLEAADNIILMTDDDPAGSALKEEVARRAGRAKCKEVKYPTNCKDANEVLLKFSSQHLLDLIQSAEYVPLDGIYSAVDYLDEVRSLYDNGMMSGVSTGIPSVDGLFTISGGQLSVVTGTPGSGKSEFIDQLMVNLARNESWKWAVASFENPPALHIAKLCEKISGKPFFQADGRTRMDTDESKNAIRFINKHFTFIEQRSGDMIDLESLLSSAQQGILRLGCRGLVIDPYNYIQQDNRDENEHQFINKMLTRLVAFARSHDIHIFLVAHPSKMSTDTSGNSGIPNGHHVSGSAAWFAKCDLGITVHRGNPADNTPEVHCWKCRFKWQGKLGSTCLSYNPDNGIFAEQEFDLDLDEIDF